MQRRSILVEEKENLRVFLMGKLCKSWKLEAKEKREVVGAQIKRKHLPSDVFMDCMHQGNRDLKSTLHQKQHLENLVWPNTGLIAGALSWLRYTRT